MPKRRLTWILIVASLAVLFLLGSAAAWMFFSQPTAPLPSPGPDVRIISPGAVDLVHPLELIEITAIASGDQPIHHLELWLDGQLSQTFYNPDPRQASPIQVSFSQPLAQGNHFLFIRAVDTYNLIGQSLPLTATGTLVVSGRGPHTLVSAPPDGILPEGPLDSGSAAPIAVPIKPEEGAPPSNPTQPAGNPTILDLIKLLPGANPPLKMFPAEVFGPPPAPADFQASAAECSLTFSWQDTGEVESGFQIWVTGLGVSPRAAALIKAAPGTGPVQVEIPALGSGDYVYWVEAYNYAGAQPSNQMLISVPGPCPSQLNSSLSVEVIDLTAPAQYDRAYCYVSILDNPEVRLPAGQDQFISLNGGSGDITSVPLGSRRYKLPASTQNLTIGGECWGWAGASLSKLGAFNKTIPPAQWDGSRIPLNGAVFEIGLEVNSIPGELVPFAAPDPGIPSPILVSLEKTASLADVGLDPMDALNYLGQGDKRVLVWEWLPPLFWDEKLTGFTVLINGIPYQQISDPDARSAEIQVPGFCGTEIKVSLIANSVERHSLPSNQLSDQQNPCQLYAVVDFKSVQFGWVNDSLNPNNHCDDVQTFFHISVSEVFNRGQANEVKGTSIIKHFNGGGFYQQVHCGTWDLNLLAGPAATAKELDPTRIILPLRLIEGQNTEYDIESTIWDYDSGSGNDVIARYLGTIFFNPGMVDGLLAKMQDDPARLEDYYCDAYIATFDGDAKSKIDICVDLYAQHPASGAAALPENTVPSKPITSGPGQQYDTNSDLALTGIYLNPEGKLTARVQNLGPEDLKTANLEFTTTIQGDDPGLSSTPSTTSNPGYELTQGSRRDYSLFTWDQLNPAQYNYTISVELKGTGFRDPDLSNNKQTLTWSGSGSLATPEALDADLKLVSVRSDGSGGLAVAVENGGPDALQQLEATVTCEATQVSRVDGSSTTIKGLEQTAVLNLNAQKRQTFKLTIQNGIINLLTHWYQVSCQVKTSGPYNDPDPANNFINQALH